MSEQDWRRAKEVFGEALDLPEQERATYLDAACAGDPDLRARVESLLASHSAAGEFLAAPTADVPIPPAAPLDGGGEAVGQRIGPYTLLSLVGEGGFGVVYAAEQHEPLHRRVALKVIKLGMDTRQVIARFEQERQALALMDHPGIARVFDAGATAAGRPYFVMELIKGVPITEYCDKARLSIPERLELFMRVCQAVQHAHQKGLIHRDLKPGNVLVTLQDGKPVPKIIDFGVAKATAARLTEKTVFTEQRQLIGTPEYMSPEQADLTGLDIDTRSDVYSLGVLLYELLTGATPFDPRRLRSAAFGEMQRIIREVDPPKPSTRLSTLENLANVAACRQTEPRRLGALVRGDLDWIVMRCVEKDRSRRYETASALAADLHRHLAGEAVAAAPPSAAYRTAKFIRRHRVGVFATGALALTLIGGVIATTWQAVRAMRAEADQRRVAQAEAAARSEADSKRALAERTSAFMSDMLGGVRPAVATGRDTTVLKELMDDAAARIEAGELQDEPEAEVKLRLTIGRVYSEIAEYAPAEAMLKPTIDLARALAPPGADTPEMAASLLTWGVYLRTVGRSAEADSILQQALDMDRRLFKGDHSVVAQVLGDLAETRLNLGQYADTERLYQESLDILQRLHKGDHPDVAAALSNLAVARQVLGRPGDGEPLLEQSAQMLQRLHKGDHPDVATALNNLALVRRQLGRPADAEVLYQQVLDMRRRLFQGDHPLLAATLVSLAFPRRDLGRPADAEPLEREALEMFQRLFPGDNADVAKSLNSLAMTYIALQRPADAEPLLRQSLEMKQRLYKGDHPTVAYALNNLGGVRKDLGHAEEAEPLFRQALEMRQRLYKDADHPDVANSLQNVARVLQTLDRPAEAEPLYQQALEMLRRLYERDNLEVANCLGLLAECVEDLGRTEDAMARQREALAVQRSCLPADSPALASGLSSLGSALLRYGGREGAAEAESVLRECLAIRQKAFPDGHAQQWQRYQATSLLGGALAAQSKFAEAEPLLVDGYTGMEGDSRAGADATRKGLERMVRLYEAWDKADPGKGYDAKAAQWKARLDALLAAPDSSGK